MGDISLHQIHGFFLKVSKARANSLPGQKSGHIKEGLGSSHEDIIMMAEPNHPAGKPFGDILGPRAPGENLL